MRFILIIWKRPWIANPYLHLSIALTISEVSISVGLDDIVDSASIFYRIRSIVYYHVRSFACGMDMDIAISEDSLEDSGCMSINFLDSIETTFCYSSWKCGNLLDSNHSRVSDDKKIKLIINPVKKDKCKKGNPIDSYASPINCLIANDINNRVFISKEYPRSNNKREKVEEVIDENYPMTVKSHYDLFVVFEEGNMFFFDHVICGSLR